MYYDLHIHSVLSPCSEDEMTIHNIINMALIKDLDLIAITDHNSVKQLKAFREVAKGKIKILLGVEIQSKDDIHILAYFNEDKDLDEIQNYLDQYLIEEPNRPEYYGRQVILDENDNEVDEEHRLLISSLERTTREIIEDIHHMGGKAVLAHVYRKYGYINHYGTLDEQLNFDGVEVHPDDYHRFIQEYPNLKDGLILRDSDAHQLVMINEPEYRLTLDQYLFLKGAS